MTLASTAGIVLPLAAPILVTISAVACLSRRLSAAAGPLILLALAADVAVSGAAEWLTRELGAGEQALFTWSPLGLYGVTLGVRRTADVALLSAPALVLAWCGVTLATRRRRWFSALTDFSLAERFSWCAGLLAVVGALWCGRAADFVSLFMGTAFCAACSTGVLVATAGGGPAARRLALAFVSGIALLSAGLVLGRVNGHFQLSGLSMAGFGAGPFTGLAAMAAFVASAPPFHGWLVRSARHPLTPALAAAGVSVAAALLLVAFRTVQPEGSWLGVLRVFGWLSVAIGGAVSLTRQRAPVRLAAATVARTGVLFLAASVGTPAALTGALLLFLFAGTVLGGLWLTATQTWGGRLPQRGPAVPAARAPGFWLNLLLVATAAGLPPTVGGLARSTLTVALTSWPSGDQLLRVPLFIADVAVLLVGANLLWRPHFLPPLRGRPGWAVVAVAAAVLCGPALAPQQLIAPWLGPGGAAAVGTTLSPVRFDALPLPTIASAALALVAAWALARRLRGGEWLPPLGLALMGAVVLGWSALRRRWRARGWAGAPAAMANLVWLRFQSLSERALLILRPVEERYYAGAAILMAVAIIFIVGR